MKFPVLGHTFLSAWDNCSHKAYRQYIAKDLPRQPQTKEMAWGVSVHSAFEARLKGKPTWPVGMEKYEAIAAPLVAAGAEAEKMVGIRENGSSCDFFDNDVWLRGKIDATVLKRLHIEIPAPDHAVIADWKTGKRCEEKAELETHAVLLHALYPPLQKITAHYVWLQDMQVGKAHDVSDTETKLAEIRSVANVVKNNMATGFFPKRQNGLCPWCPVKDCEFNR